jgi:hypothetical protein
MACNIPVVRIYFPEASGTAQWSENALNPVMAAMLTGNLRNHVLAVVSQHDADVKRKININPNRRMPIVQARSRKQSTQM